MAGPALQRDLQWKIPVPALRSFLTSILSFKSPLLSAEFAAIFQAGASVLVWLLDWALNSLEILNQPRPATPSSLSFNICARARATFASEKYSNE